MKLRYKIGISTDKESKERAITPTLIYLREPEYHQYGLNFHGIGLGWWKWAVYLFIAIHKT